MTKNITKHLYWIIPLGILLLLVLWFVSSYNGLVNADVDIDVAWAQVQSTYQRRADLIPNLVNTVQGAVDFEQGTQTKIAELRTQATQVKSKIQSASTPADLEAAGAELKGIETAYRGLNINVENYPQLRATENFLSLQDELAGTENRINVARQRFNDKVGIYNKKVRRIPTNIIAGMFGFEKKTPFEAVEGTEVVPGVDFT